MSIIDNVLVTIDDDDRTKQDLESLFPKENTSVLFSALGRLVGRGLIKKEGKGKEKTYSITDKGADTVELSLDYLRDLTDGEKLNWILVSASIPEKYKVERERIRLTLKDWGFGLIKNGLFVGQVNDIEKFKKSILEIKTNTQVYIFPVDQLPIEITKKPELFWNIEKLRDQYQTWSYKTQAFIKNLPKDEEIRRILAKSHVYELALIIKKDPKIIEPKFSNLIGRTNALKLYKGIRDYCYR